MINFILSILFSINSQAAEIKGGRMGLHGMVLYGSNGVYFLDHIPMEHEPHDFQIITEVVLKNEKGVEIKKDFSKEAFTFKPDTNFSLNDYLSGELTHFNGTIFTGSFEQGGKELLNSISVTVKNIKLARKIPAPSNESQIEVTDGTNLYSVNIITPTQNFQSIQNTTLKKPLWCVKAPDFFEQCE